MSRIVLASASPRRRELLTQIGLKFDIMPSQIEEVLKGSSPAENVMGLAQDKASDIYRQLTAQDEKDVLVIGADTVVALDDKILGKTYGYRDSRNNGMDEKVYEIIPEKELYQRTGIQKASFNTIYQLMAVKQNNPEHMEAAETVLFIPDYFNFKLTGVKVNEYTEASTGQLLNPETKDWDYELIEMLGYNKNMLCSITKPGTKVGNFTKEVQKEVGFDCDRSSLLDTLDDAKHLELILDSQTVAALDLYSSCTHGHDFTHTHH